MGYGSLRMSRRKFTVVSLFSGCGGFDLAAEMTGRARVVWANDNFSPAVESYRRNFSSFISDADIRQVAPPNLECDVLIGGPPCQDFSVLWLHEGARTSRGSLYMEFVRFLGKLRPKAFVL